MPRLTRRLFLAAALTCLLLPQFAFSAGLPRVVILATGGTIAGQASSTTEEGYQSGKLAVDALIKAVPEISKIADVRGEQIASIPSQNMDDAIWLKLARRVNQLLSASDVDGIVITHGTDTMEETAYFLNLVVRSPKSVVITGAMRPANAISADGPLNLYNAVAVAADPRSQGRGVLVVMDDQIHSAHDVTKSNTTSTETFISPLQGLIGTSHFGVNHYFRGPVQKHTASSEFAVDGIDRLPRVSILYAYAGMSADLVEASVKNGAQGIVVAGVGSGNMSEAALNALADATKKGVVVVRSSRVGSGFVARNVEVDDDRMGFVASGDLNPARARILLELALLKTHNTNKIQDYFNQY